MFFIFWSELTGDVQLKLCHRHQMVWFLIQLKRVWWSKKSVITIRRALVWPDPTETDVIFRTRKIFRCPSLDWRKKAFQIDPKESLNLTFPGSFLYTWNLFVFWFGGWTLKKKALWDQNKGHLGSKQIYVIPNTSKISRWQLLRTRIFYLYFLCSRFIIMFSPRKRKKP